MLITGANSKQVSDSLKDSVPASYIAKIYTLSKFDHPTADVVESAMTGLIAKNAYKRVIGLASSFGKDVIPRVAGKHGAQAISDITEFVVKIVLRLGQQNIRETDIRRECLLESEVRGAD